MSECGLPTVRVAVAQNGNPVMLAAYSGGNRDANGNTFSFTLANDMPYYGGQLLTNIPCSYTTGADPATLGKGMSFTYTVMTPNVQVQLNDGTMATATYVVSAGSN
ncbi:hypothetical protein HK101_010816 [Irineochytrium annulatum]|nr:hypothetical protein HK101_010816 [Irineochytrium annulatum]